MKSTKEIMKFAFPAIVENFLQMCVGLSDTFLVTRIGLSAVAAVSLANTIIAVYQALFIAIGTIVASLYARKKSEKNSTQRQELINSAVKLTVLCGGGLGLFSILFGRVILAFFGGRGSVLTLSYDYLALVGGTIVLLGLMTTFGSFLRADGDSKTPMFVSLWINIFNLFLAAFFIFGLHLGVLGAALGTFLARLLGTLFLYKKTTSARANRHFFKQKINLELIKLTFPAVGERLAMRLGDLLIMVIVISFGEKVFAGNAIGESITQFNYMPMFGIATVTVILVAQEFGQGNFDHIHLYIKKTCLLSIAMMGLIGGGILLLSFPLSRAFTQDMVAVKSSMIVILFSFLSVWFVAGANIYTAAFQGIGNAKLPFYATTFGMVVVRAGMGFLFGHYLGLGLEGVWCGVMLDNLFRYLFLKLRFKKIHQNTKAHLL